MLKLKVKGIEFFDEKSGEFLTVSDTVLQLEHSLLSISKWESKWHKPFFGQEPRTVEEARDYICCMTININGINPLIYRCLTNANMKEVGDYINDPMTATTFRKDAGIARGRKHTVTAEELYYAMFSNGIPIDCEKWHLNRLMTLLRVFAVKDTPAKKMSKKDLLARNSALNASRRAKMGSKG